jgi:hypothetical protein
VDFETQQEKVEVAQAAIKADQVHRRLRKKTASATLSRLLYQEV